MKLFLIFIMSFSYSFASFGIELGEDAKKRVEELGLDCKKKLKCTEELPNVSAVWIAPGDIGERLLFPAQMKTFINTDLPGEFGKVKVGSDQCDWIKSHKDDICVADAVEICSNPQTASAAGCDLNEKISNHARDSYNPSVEQEMVPVIAEGLMSYEYGEVAKQLPKLEDCKGFIDQSIAEAEKGNIPDAGEDNQEVLNQMKADREKKAKDLLVHHTFSAQIPFKDLFKVQDYLTVRPLSCTSLFTNGGQKVDDMKKFLALEESSLSIGEDNKKNMCNYFVEESSCLDELAQNDNENSYEKLKQMKTCFNEDAKDKFDLNMKMLTIGCVTLNKVYQKVAPVNGPDEDIYTVDAVGAGPKGEGVAFSKGGFRCYNRLGHITLDFLSCKRAAQAFNASLVGGDIIGGMGVQTYDAIENMNIQSDATKAASEPDEDGVVAGFNSTDAAFQAQKDRHKLERNKALINMTNKSAQGAWGAGQLLSYVTPKKVLNSWCNDGDSNAFDIKPLEACVTMALWGNENSLNSNQSDGAYMWQMFFNKRTMSVIAENTGRNLSQALASGIVAAFQNKQAKMVGEVQKKWEKANFNNQGTEMERQEYCKQYPRAPLCRENGTGGGGGGGGLDFQFNTNGGGPNNLAYENDSALGEFNEEERELSGNEVANLNDIMGGDASAKGTSGIKDKISAAGGSTSNRGGGGGGSGGGAGGGGGGGGGDSAGAGNRGGGAGSKLNVPGAKYLSGTNGKFATGKGGKSSKKGSRNPFSGLVGKRSGRGVASQKYNDIMPKNIRLFSAISKKYNQVNKEGRLEKVKAKEVGL